ncbi:leucyl/phenylalanyl-tRNA--protein transferase [Alcaligenaceae bacterium]|nr:leucyl/phenylalanyl-tRNA--protein transferase [Alcaligenaceae bacterium]
MTGLTWLDDHMPFPDPVLAMPEGLLAAGADLSIPRLTEAYSKGIFPWYNEGDPILWWSPDPRMVLACDHFKVSRSLSKKLKSIAHTERTLNSRVRITTDVAFRAVIAACAGPRGTQRATWISLDVQQAYYAWHQAGAVHSVETWIDGKLAGGLYGVCLGRFFFGESMFSHASDASKLALAYLTRFLLAQGVKHIDCQQQTRHLASLGAGPIPRRQFLALLTHALSQPSPDWKPGQLLYSGELAPLGQTTS